jgi:orotidine-5'-phosphate decarboxylase
MATEVIVALDVDTPEDAVAAVKTCGGCSWFKVGLQLFTRSGPSMVETLGGEGVNLFLDLKLHDIPNTVEKAAKAAADLGVGLITVHACGGKAMIQAARQGVAGSDTRVLAVTVLTSVSEAVLRDEIGLSETPGEAVARFAKQSVDAGAHGVVASPKEITIIREAVGAEPLVVTPGIRPAWASKDDQARVMTPREAAEAGANFIVVGRPILKHDKPAEAVRLIQQEMQL